MNILIFTYYILNWQLINPQFENLCVRGLNDFDFNRLCFCLWSGLSVQNKVAVVCRYIICACCPHKNHPGKLWKTSFESYVIYCPPDRWSRIFCCIYITEWQCTGWYRCKECWPSLITQTDTESNAIITCHSECML